MQFQTLFISNNIDDQKQNEKSKKIDKSHSLFEIKSITSDIQNRTKKLHYKREQKKRGLYNDYNSNENNNIYEQSLYQSYRTQLKAITLNFDSLKQSQNNDYFPARHQLLSLLQPSQQALQQLQQQQISIPSFTTKFIHQLNHKQNIKYRKQQKKIQINVNYFINYKFIDKELIFNIILKAGNIIKRYQRQEKTKKQKWINGIKVIADFKADLLHGQAQFIYQNGAVFTGYYDEGIRISGQFDFNNGYIYKGNFKNDKFSGEGELTFPSKNVISGHWFDGKIQGNALIKYVSGDVYYGEIYQFKKHGKGYLFFKNGEKYTGEFKNGQITGQGEYFQGEICIGKGLWENGMLIENRNIFNDKDYPNTFLDSIQRDAYKILPDKIKNQIVTMQQSNPYAQRQFLQYSSSQLYQINKSTQLTSPENSQPSQLQHFQALKRSGNLQPKRTLNAPPLPLDQNHINQSNVGNLLEEFSFGKIQPIDQVDESIMKSTGKFNQKKWLSLIFE